MSIFDIIALDADDTLWHNERLYLSARDRFVQLLSQHHEPEWIGQRLDQTEMRNLQHYGYGIKSFALSMIETAIELTEGRISGRNIQVIIDEVKGMLSAEVELMDYAVETLSQLATTYHLMVITKGDLLDQEAKLARSGLAQYLRDVEVVSNKTPGSYERLLKRKSINAHRFLMAGNSLRSDILPVLELGGYAVYIPNDTTWQHEVVEPPKTGQPRYYQIEHLGQLPDLLELLERKGTGA